MSALAADTDAENLDEPRYPRRWSIDQQLTASVIDAINSLNHTLIQVNSKSKVSPPPRIPRPGFEVRAPRRMSTEQRDRIRNRNRKGV